MTSKTSFGGLQSKYLLGSKAKFADLFAGIETLISFRISREIIPCFWNGCYIMIDRIHEKYPSCLLCKICFAPRNLRRPKNRLCKLAGVFAGLQRRRFWKSSIAWISRKMASKAKFPPPVISRIHSVVKCFYNIYNRT